MELCLGTVQLGMDYGIAGQRKPSFEDAVNIIDYAVCNGIKAIDTANAYGVAEEVVGRFLSRQPAVRPDLFLVSKLKPNLLDEVEPSFYYNVMKSNMVCTLKRLHTDYLDSYLLHSSKYIYNDEIIEALYRLKKEGYTRHVGVSVYETDEAKKCVERPEVDFMQIPFSIFDQRMLKEEIFELAEREDIQVHSRSAFIQGLILMEENNIPSFLGKARPIVRKVGELCRNYEISRVELAMNFVKQQKAVSHLVFGVDNLSQLKEDIDLFSHDIPTEIIKEASREFADLETDIVIPSLWKKE